MTVGRGLYSDQIYKPPDMEWSFSSIRADTNPRTYADNLTFGSATIAGSDEFVDGSLLTWGNFDCPSGKICRQWGINEECYSGASNQNSHWYGYAKKIGKSYSILQGSYPVQATRSVFVSPQNGSEECYDSQLYPLDEFHGFFFQILFEGTSVENSVVYSQVNSVTGPDNFGSSGSIPNRPGNSCKCPGLIEGADQILYWKVGGAYASGFTV